MTPIAGVAVISTDVQRCRCMLSAQFDAVDQRACAMATTDDVRKRDLDDMTMSKDSPQHEYIINNGAATLTVTYTYLSHSCGTGNFRQIV